MALLVNLRQHYPSQRGSIPIAAIHDPCPEDSAALDSAQTIAAAFSVPLTLGAVRESTTAPFQPIQTSGFLLTGETRDDIVDTAIHALFCTGCLPQRISPITSSPFRGRPLLDFDRDELIQTFQEMKLPYRIADAVVAEMFPTVASPTRGVLTILQEESTSIADTLVGLAMERDSHPAIETPADLPGETQLELRQRFDFSMRNLLESSLQLARTSSFHWRLALSGGSDSIALLELLSHWLQSQQIQVKLSIGHINHGWRGDEARSDAKFCASIASQFNLEFVLEEEDILFRSEQAGISLETAGREVRLEKYRLWGKRDGVDTVLTAHHRDDQVETVLAHLLRGCGIHGLSAMRASRSMSESPPLDLWRPLLFISRQELVEHREASGLPYREDRTNSDRTHQRNHLRLDVLPALRALEPTIDRSLWSVAIEANSLCLQRAAEYASYLKQIRVSGPHAEVPLHAIPETLRRLRRFTDALLEALWRQFGTERGELRRSHYELWELWVRGEARGTTANFPGGRTLERSTRGLYLWEQGVEPGVGFNSSPLPKYGSVEIGGFKFEVEEERSLKRSGVIRLPAGSYVIRQVRPDDRLQGTDGGSRVCERLRSIGLPTRWHSEVPVIASTHPDSEVWFAPGLRSPTSRFRDQNAEARGYSITMTVLPHHHPVSFWWAGLENTGM